VVEPINKLIETVQFDVYCYSLDWHPSDHLSFVDNVSKRKLHESSPVRRLSPLTWSLSFEKKRHDKVGIKFCKKRIIIVESILATLPYVSIAVQRKAF